MQLNSIFLFRQLIFTVTLQQNDLDVRQWYRDEIRSLYRALVFFLLLLDEKFGVGNVVRYS